MPKVKEFVKAAYPLTSNDIYAAFIDRGSQLTEPEGYVGALVSATFVNLTTFEKLRTEILLKRNPLVVMLDLGFGILDFGSCVVLDFIPDEILPPPSLGSSCIRAVVPKGEGTVRAYPGGLGF